MSRRKALQCKHIPDLPVLEFMAAHPPGTWHSWFISHELDVSRAMPSNTPPKLVLGKMKMLIRRGLVDGCDCGCRGDFVLTPKGQRYVTAQKAPWESLDDAARANLHAHDLADFFRYRDALRAEGHTWAGDAEAILSGFIWDTTEGYEADEPDDEEVGHA